MNDSNTNMHQFLQQQLWLTPQQIQAMKVLQMGYQELLDYINCVAEENPVIEKDEPACLQESFFELQKKAYSFDGYVNVSSVRADTIADASALYGFSFDESAETSLSVFLNDQLYRLHLTDPLSSLCQYLIGMLTEDGYLVQDDLNELISLGIPSKLQEKAIRTLQNLEPSGVAARDLQECLLLQIERSPSHPPLVKEIVLEYLDLLGKNQIFAIANALNASVESVNTAVHFIQSLQPRPGAAFAQESVPEYINPDVFICQTSDGIKAVLNDRYLPRIRISNYYQRLMQESGEDDVQEYLHKQISNAKQLIENIDRRHRTLQNCSDAIIKMQYDFFSGESSQLCPLNQATVADMLGVHVSTISRCISGKYLQCQKGTFPLRYFFPSCATVNSQEISSHAVQQILIQIVRSEDKMCPLSDKKIADILYTQGCPVSRRTITKYREMLRIPSSRQRKAY